MNKIDDQMMIDDGIDALHRSHDKIDQCYDRNDLMASPLMMDDGSDDDDDD